MPLLKRQPFVKQKLPPDLDPNEELFFCKLTKEVFRDYDEFFERVILCNSLVWTCELTGRPGLTYQEALESEARARRCLKSFPDSLKIPILYLATLTCRGRLADMCDDVYGFARERYFIGEEVEGAVDGQRVHCEIVNVLPPPLDMCNGFHDDDASSVELEGQSNGHEEGDKKRQFGPHPSLYEYAVITTEEDTKHILSHEHILRKKGSFTREKIKLFLKQYCEPRDGIWRLKRSIEKKWNIAVISFTDVFAGPLPRFVKSQSKKIVPHAVAKHGSGLKAKTATLNGTDIQKKRKPEAKKASRDIKTKTITHNDVLEMRKELENRQRAKEEAKQRRKEEKEKERERKREERRIRAELLREWQKPRDDLECDDLREIPVPTPINCSFPNELFGDAVMVIEFLHTFGDLFKVNDFFPNGFGFDHLEKSLVETDVRGLLGDVLQFFLHTIFSLQEGEEVAFGTRKMESPDIADGNDEESDLTNVQVTQAAIAAASWPQRCQGLSLQKLALDSFTVSEILRIHLLSFGSQFANIKSLQQGKVCFTVFDDPVLQLRLRDPALLKALSSKSIFDFNPAERLQVFQVLINQLLSFMVIREQIEENLEKIRNARSDLKQLQWAEQRREREEAALKLQKKIEEQGDKKSDDTNENISEVDESKVKKKKLAEELAQQKRDNLKKRELTETINKLLTCNSVQPLGRDRSYRRFWIFESLPGLYVEDDDDLVGDCLKCPTPAYVKTPVVQESEQKPNVSILETEKVSDSVCEPRCTESSSHKIKHRLSSEDPTETQTNENCESSENLENKLNNGGKALDEEGCKRSQETYQKSMECFGKCTGCMDDCPVHGHAQRADRSRWAFVGSAEELDLLLAALNQRGFRESSLREALHQDKLRIVQSIQQCPVQKLNPEKAIDFQHPHETRKASRLNGVPVSVTGVSAEEVMETTLREMLLDLEERIYAGSLGCIKVNSREMWRKAILERMYDMQCDSLHVGPKQENDGNTVDQDSDSGRGTPMDMSEQESASQRSNSPITVNQTVKDMASALLQIAQGIEFKYLRSPLGEDVETKKPKSKSSDSKKGKKDDNDKEISEKTEKTKPQKTVYERWENSLMASTSFSQVFVHLTTLERSVAWSRSVLNARCRICHRRGDAERMLLCDECNRGHHMYCLKPSLTEVPSGDWFCPDCKPKETVAPVPKKPSRRMSYSDEDDDDEIDMQDNASDEEKESFYTDEEDVEEDDEEESEVNNDDVCDVCEGVGHLICCDNCPLAFHLECIDPPLRRVPKGRWDCPNCAEQSQSVDNLKDRLRKPGKRRVPDGLVEGSPAKRTRSRDLPIIDDDEIWMCGRKRHGPPNRRGASRDAPVDYKFCDQMLSELSRQESSWPFMRPVSRKQFPIYYEVIKRPIDLATMRFKLNNMEYRSTKQFLMDVLILIQNCIMYNPLDSNEYTAAVELMKFVEEYSLSVGFTNLENLLNHQSSFPTSPASPPEQNLRRTDSSNKLDAA